MPSTIEEDDLSQQFTTFESLGEKSGGTLETVEDPGKFRLSKFSFMSNATQESTPEEIEQARTSFRQSMTGNFTRRDTRRATNMTMGTVISDITEADTEAEDVADSIAHLPPCSGASFTDYKKLGKHYVEAHDGPKFACEFEDW